jgi:hypothetical protein
MKIDEREFLLAKSLVPGDWFAVVSVPVQFGDDLSCWDGIWLRIADPSLDVGATYVPAANMISGEIKAVPSAAQVGKQVRSFDFQVAKPMAMN